MTRCVIRVTSRKLTKATIRYDKYKLKSGREIFLQIYFALSNDIFFTPHAQLDNYSVAMFAIINFCYRYRFLWTSAADPPRIARLCG